MKNKKCSIQTIMDKGAFFLRLAYKTRLNPDADF